MRLIISAPYSFNTAEKVFGKLKNKDFNPDSYPTGKK
jgi:hypothetical protein